jgi:hypothetical protein
VNIKYDNVLRYVLIILLVFTPMRSVLAEQVSHCNMEDMPAMSVTVSTHHMHVSQADQISDHINQSQLSQHECCCCDADSCAGNCDMGMTVSLLMQVSPYSPVLINTEKLILSSSKLLIRALSPPSRPPLTLS